ncbi:hypothetical protein, partial [Frigoribacterium faeni]|uniref:hypothetical protein n=1 Tax=Frigoribacterium faeni TaxID=145483 RepID=UPI0035ADAD26
MRDGVAVAVPGQTRLALEVQQTEVQRLPVVEGVDVDAQTRAQPVRVVVGARATLGGGVRTALGGGCLLYTSDAADDGCLVEISVGAGSLKKKEGGDGGDGGR